MTREQLEHVIRAAAAIKCVAQRAKDARFIVVMLKDRMITPATLEQRMRQLDPQQPIDAIVAWARRRAAEALT